jgi:hypothetical protein
VALAPGAGEPTAWRFDVHPAADAVEHLSNNGTDTRIVVLTTVLSGSVLGAKGGGVHSRRHIGIRIGIG